MPNSSRARLTRKAGLPERAQRLAADRLVASAQPAPNLPQRKLSPDSLTEQEVLQLQSSLGNRAVARLTGQAATFQKTTNKTGLADNLKSGVEVLSGQSLDDVSVHFNSGAAAAIQADAFTEGSQIHVAPGREDSLPHEAWHVVQQKQGRVDSNLRLGSHRINLDAGLEHEADLMGERARKMYNPAARLPSASRVSRSSQMLGHPTRTASTSVRQFRCGSRRRAVAQSPFQQIMQNHAVTGPHIVFRMDSRPIGLALEKGYTGQEGEETITEGGENQNMVGGSHNFVGSYSYTGYGKLGAHTNTKQEWQGQKGGQLFWTACIVRSGGKTYEWLLSKIPEKGTRDRIRELVMNRKSGDSETDQELNELTLPYQGEGFQGMKNIGTTEIVTSHIPPEDILGYFPIDRKSRVADPYVEVHPLESVDGFDQIPDEDKERYKQFVSTGGHIKQSTFV